jgi:hypothetical protein
LYAALPAAATALRQLAFILCTPTHVLLHCRTAAAADALLRASECAHSTVQLQRVRLLSAGAGTAKCASAGQLCHAAACACLPSLLLDVRLLEHVVH